MSLMVFVLESGEKIKELPEFRSVKSMDEATGDLPQGVYSTFRTHYGGQKVVGFRAHLDRLYGPARDRMIEPLISKVELRKNLRKILEGFRSQEARIRISLSLSEQVGRIFVITEPLRLVEEKVYGQGVRAITSHVERMDPRVKSTTFIQNSAQERLALNETNVFEALMVRNNRILEGFTSNFFAVKNSRIITAQKEILLGVTRRVIIRLLRSEGDTIEFRSLRIEELVDLDEAFITSSSRGVIPVREINGTIIGQGNPGRISRMLRMKYDDYVMKMAEKI